MRNYETFREGWGPLTANYGEETEQVEEVAEAPVEQTPEVVEDTVDPIDEPLEDELEG